MRALLLDTNAFAMALTDDGRLPSSARQAIEAADRVALSAISLYEIGQKVRLGKWPAMTPYVGSLEGQARQDGFDLVPLTPEAALTAATLDWPHRDPFDRMIAAVSRLDAMPIVSSDTAFDEIGVERIWG
ncbi:MAG: type II toxin-antitoxin system VapC family toxin [Pseudomonadota bacterium]